MSGEFSGTGFEEITPVQVSEFVGRVEELDPLLNHISTTVDEFENPFGDLPIGESLVGLTDEEPGEIDSPPLIGHLTVNNLGGLIEIGEGLTIPSDPTRMTTKKAMGAFVVDDEVVVIERVKTTEQNLRFVEDITITDFSRVKVISEIDSDNFSFWLERLYDYGSDDASFHEILYRKPKENGAEWVLVAAPSWSHILNGTTESTEEAAEKADQKVENPNRFDQNRFGDVMIKLAKIDESNRLDSIPSLGQASYKVVSE